MAKRFTLRLLTLLTFTTFILSAAAQSGTEFWLAPPDITDLHNSPGGEPIYLLVSSTGQASTVTIEQPANGSFTPIVVNVAANKSVRVNLTSFKSQLETRPTNTILNTGLHVTSTTTITCYYECANTNNTDIWALKGPNAEGTEFYIPLHKHSVFNNEVSFASPHQAFASFDICATQNNTVVTIYSPTAVDGHAALQQFQITLNRGQTYSCGWTGANWSQPSTHPSGAIVLATLPVTVSLKDDSDHNPSGGCYDILGDQIVPVDVVGEDYIAVKGSLNNNGDESVVLMATQNNTQVHINGGASPIATLFAGEYFRIDMDSLATSVNNAIHIHCSRPTYAMHITGFGCEMGMAQLPPLNCAGSQTLNFVRDDAQTFYITVLCRATAVNGFTITGSGTATIPPASFVTVPGTGGVWTAAKITYNTTQVPVDSTFKVSNSIDVFALGVVNGGATSGCKYGYFSEYVAPITTNAGTDQTICANSTATLSGTVAGGTITGEWTSTGTGTFTPNNTTLNAVYTPSAGDAAVGSVVLTLTSTGACIPVSDQKTLTITPAPTVNAGVDQTKCSNNASVALTGTITIATGGVWTGGLGNFVPSNNVLDPVYVPTAAEIASGSITLTLTSTGNGICNPVADNILITFTTSPTANAGSDQTVCANNAATTLSGSVTIATGGVWTGGGGSFVPSASSLNPVYTPSPSEISSGSVTLTLTTTGNDNCSAVSDQMTISFSAAPVITAGPDQFKCANNASTVLAGNITGATGGQWSGGLGTFSPNNTIATATYNPTAGEIASGIVTLTFTSTGNGTCNAVSDQVAISFTEAPTSNAGTDITVCANNPTATLNGSFTISTGATWTGGTGMFNPNRDAMDATYTPSASEISGGSVILTLITTGNGTCNEVSDQVTITITPSPTVNAGLDQTRCSNNASATLSGSVTVATGGTWSGGSGTFNPSTTALNAVYTPTATEISNGSVTLTLTSTGNASCNASSDQVTIFFSSSPIADAGLGQTLCANNAVATLAGNVSVAGGGQWTGGLGIFLPNNNTLNASYSPTTAEIANGSVTLTLTTTSNGSCNSESDQVTLSFTAAPTVNAGIGQTVCANNATVNLNGSFTTATGAIWSGGNGNFLPNNTTMNATYTPTPSEISEGSVVLTLTSTGNGTCSTVSDQVTITITGAPVVNAGADLSRCANNPDASLSGSVTVASGGTWSGGGGTFNPSSSSLNAVYTPTASEIANGSVTLTLTSTGNGICNQVSDQVTITYTSQPTVSAGPDQTLCANNAVVSLLGNVTNAGGGQWSGGLGIFTPNNNSLNAVYTPTTSEIASGSLALTLTTTSNGGCNAVSDAIILFFTTAPTVSASSDITVCANNPEVSLNGSFSISGGIVWTGGSGSYSPSNTSAITSYTPSSSEITNGTAVLTITTTSNGTCNAVSDNITINILPSPVVNAGNNISACENNPEVTLAGQVFNANGGIWSGGSGSFFPSASTLNATYSPSTSEINNGSVILTLTSTGNGNCNAVSDQVTITFAPSPVVNAGNDLTLCGNNAIANLNGSFSFCSGIQWSGGLGLFQPGADAPQASYNPTAGEIANGFVNLIITSTGNGTCLADVDTVHINYLPAPTANAGSDLVSCANNAAVNLTGGFANSTGAIWSGGLGLFLPSNTSMNASYSPTASEIALGEVTLTLTTTGNGICLPASDQVEISIISSPLVNAGADQTTCVNNLNIGLSGSVSGPTNTGSWATSGTGTFIPNNTTLNAIYQCSPADVTAGSVVLTLTSTNNGSCVSVTDMMTITISPPGTANAGNNQTVCGNNANVNLAGTVGGGSSSGFWGTTGTGTFSPSNQSLNTIYIPSQFDILNGNVTLYLTANSCNLAVDSLSVQITPAPVVITGSDLTICSSELSVPLNGSISGGSSSGIWTTSGTGTFSPNNSTLNGTYSPGTSDIAQQGVTLYLTSTSNGQCLPVADTLNINIYPSGTANAGNDQILCANNASAFILGQLGGGSTEGLWTTNGSGIFLNGATSLANTYQPSVADISNGSVTLTLTATNSCNNASDALVIQFTPAPTIMITEPDPVCANNAAINLSGSITVASGGSWTGGSGNYVPGNNQINTTYTPSASEINNGNVTLTFTTDGNGLCNAVTASTTIEIIPSPVVSAGADQQTCVTDLSIALSGSVSGNTTSGIWTTNGTGNFSPSAAALNAVYTLSNEDVNNGGVLLTLTSTNNAACNSVSDNMNIEIIPAGSADAGIDQTVCANNNNVGLFGTIGGGASSGTWTTTGTGIFIPNNSTLNAIYVPSAVDNSNGSVTIILTATTCSSTADSLVVTITPAPDVNAGSDQTICATITDVSLNGIISGGSTTGVWTTTGSGNFTPSTSSLNAVYHPSASDVNLQNIFLVLTSTTNGNCLPVADSMALHIYPLGTASAGTDQLLCSNNPNSELNGSLGGGATIGQWSTTGSGFFVPNNATLDATYVPSQADLFSGGVILSLNAVNSCNNAIDFLSISYSPAPIVNAGNNQSQCGDNPTFVLGGSVQNAIGANWSGQGNFSPSSTSLNATYTPSIAEQQQGFAILTLTSTGNGDCIAVSDTITLYMSDGIIASAGPDQVVCESATFTNMNGIISNGSTSGTWTTLGSGTFSPSPDALNAVYEFSAADIISGDVTLIITSLNNGNCPVARDTMHVTFGQSAFAFAGYDQNVCNNEGDISLHGFVTGGATQGIWTTTGNGSFTPANNSLEAVYAITPSDIANGSVTFFLATLDHGTCQQGMDTMIYSINPPSEVSLPADFTVCENQSEINLFANVNGTTQDGTWSTSGTGTFSDLHATNTTYFPGAFDIVNGSALIAFTANNTGACTADSDSILISIQSLPIVMTGSDQQICSSQNTIELSNNFGGSTTSVNWTTSGNGTFTPEDNNNTIYTISNSDILSGTVQLIVNTIGQTVCPADSDTLFLSITPESIVNAGNDRSVCGTELDVQLNANISGASTTGLWTTTGSGTFNPSPSDLDAIYQPGAGDISVGEVVLILTSDNTGICSPAVDSLTIFFNNMPEVNAGIDQDVCTTDLIQLNGSIGTSSIASHWMASGNGSFSNVNSLTSTYELSTGDMNNGSVSFILMVDAMDGCQAVADTVVFTLHEGSNVNAGNDISFCESGNEIQLAGVITGASTTGIWTSSGTGTFSPDANTLDAMYQLSASDILNGEIDLFLAATNTGFCEVGLDTVHIHIDRQATVNAGSDIAICSSTSTIQLGGNSDVSNITWSTTGSGSFFPSNSDPAANYQLSVNDQAASSFMIILSAQSEGVCDAVSDTLEIALTTSPQVNAGSDLSICSDDLTVPLNGNISGDFESYQWMTLGSGSFTPSANQLDAIYHPGANDSLVGSVMLVLLAEATGICNDVQDTLLVTFFNPAVVNAGPDQSICSTDETVSLNGQVSGGSSTGIWSSGGSGQFDDNTILNAVYTPSAADISSGGVILSLLSSGTGVCTPTSDDVFISFLPQAIVNAGSDRVICGEIEVVQLDGIISGSTTTGIWSGNGTGSFVPGSATLNSIYQLSNSDLNNGSVMLVLTSTNNNLCGATSDTLYIIVEEEPIAAFNSISGDALDVQFSDESINAVSWYWDFGLGGTATTSDPMINYPSAGFYDVMLIVESAGGCADTATATVEAIEKIGTPVAIPSGFSPNGDDSNDVLHVLGGPFTEVEFKIYNGWGNLVFQTNDPLAGWDGTYKGEKQPGGVYVYTAEGTTVKGRYVRLSGSVTLIR